jgi:hypothetical protein
VKEREALPFGEKVRTASSHMEAVLTLMNLVIEK